MYKGYKIVFDVRGLFHIKTNENDKVCTVETYKEATQRIDELVGA